MVFTLLREDRVNGISKLSCKIGLTKAIILENKHVYFLSRGETLGMHDM